MFRNKTFLKIFSLLLAVLLWMYVMGEVDPETKETIREIPVSYINTDVLEERGLAVIQEKEIFVAAVIEGKRSDVNAVKKAGLSAYVDVAECDKGKSVQKINVSVPVTVSLESLSMNTVKVKVEKLVEERKPIKIEFTDTVSGTDKMVRVLEFQQDSVLVKGSKSSVESITELKGVISANKASEAESKWVAAALTPVNKEGMQVLGVTCQEDKVKARIQLLSIKTVNLSVTMMGLETGSTIEKMETPERIQIIGPIYEVEGLDAVSGTVDLKGVKNEADLEVILNLPQDTFILEENNKPMAKVTVKTEE